MVSATYFVDKFPVFVPKLRIMLVADSYTNCLKPNITLFYRVVVDYMAKNRYHISDTGSLVQVL